MISQFSGAVLDHTRQYRFLLWRFWNESPRVLFIGLNPSTADEYQDDPTIKRCMGFAKAWGYGGLYICNVYGYRATNPDNLSHVEANHAANLHAIRMAKSLCVLSVAAWGDGINKVWNGNGVADNIKEILESPMCFGLTQKGNPKHPLYLPNDAELVELVP